VDGPYPRSHGRSSMTALDIAGLCKRLDILHKWQSSLRDRETITLAKTTIERQAAEIERLRALLMLARPFVADDTEATCDLADRIDAALTGEDHD